MVESEKTFFCFDTVNLRKNRNKLFLNRFKWIRENCQIAATSTICGNVSIFCDNFIGNLRQFVWILRQPSQTCDTLSESYGNRLKLAATVWNLRQLSKTCDNCRNLAEFVGIFSISDVIVFLSESTHQNYSRLISAHKFQFRRAHHLIARFKFLVEESQIFDEHLIN